MERKKGLLPPGARYPLFLVGLLILIVGELGAVSSGASTDTEAGIAALGFLFLVLSVVLR